jgi:hypothetical protein
MNAASKVQILEVATNRGQQNAISIISAKSSSTKKMKIMSRKLSRICVPRPLLDRIGMLAKKDVSHLSAASGVKIRAMLKITWSAMSITFAKSFTMIQILE